MSSRSEPASRSAALMAVITCVIALLPIALGSLVTTMKAGMAFADWPTSDGQNMILYPWLSDFRDHPDKFVEHGHRLAGMLIGLTSVALVLTVYRSKNPAWVRHGAWLILAAVIGQGLLGGARVRLDRQVLAMVHSCTGALYFALCCVYTFLVRQSRRPETPNRSGEGPGLTSRLLSGTATVLPLIVFAQFVLGGFVRHIGSMLHEHLAGAVIVLAASLTVVFRLRASGEPGLRRRATLIFCFLAFQIALGAGAWLTRFGLPAATVRPQLGSPLQAVVCSLHTIIGMGLFASVCVTAVHVRAVIGPAETSPAASDSAAASLVAAGSGGAA